MNKFDKMFGGILLGFVIPIIALCVFWWGIFLLGLDIQIWAITRGTKFNSTVFLHCFTSYLFLL
ncbi:MAG: hypothetical protein PWQ60_478 [Thermoanaerobacteraceae bacterium]|nr:hypothetical protein [Thermoanaerobacteraceae bacterium]